MKPLALLVPASFVLASCGGPSAPPPPPPAAPSAPGRFSGTIDATMDGGGGTQPMKIGCSVAPGHMRCDIDLDGKQMVWIVDVAKQRYCATLPGGKRVVEEAAALEKVRADEIKLPFVRTGKTPTIAGRPCVELEATGGDGNVRACIATGLSPTAPSSTLPLTGAMMPLLRELDVEGIVMALEVKTKEGVGLHVDVQRVVEQPIDPKVFDGC